MKSIKLDIEIEEIRPLASGEKYAGKIVALRINNSEVDFQFHEFWGKTEGDAYKKCLEESQLAEIYYREQNGS